MHTDRFDALLCTLSERPSRRVMIQAFAGVALSGSFGAMLDLGDVAAKKKKKKKKKKKRALPLASPPSCVGSCAGKACGDNGCGGSCGGCGAGQGCQAGACVTLACGSGGPCRVFVTSDPFNGSLGGVTGADITCQGYAQAAGLPGTYRAWLSDGLGASPATRFVRSPGPYQLVNGFTIANNWSDLTDGMLADAIFIDENGDSVLTVTNVWTNTQSDGMPETSNPQHCGHWQSASPGTGRVGTVLASDAAFTSQSGVDGISNFDIGFNRLYCFQQS